MKITHLTNNEEFDIAANPIYHETVQLVREFNMLCEGQALSPEQVNQLFTAAEETMNSTNKNRTMAGKAGELLGKLGQKIQSGAHWLQDTTGVKFLDKGFKELKQGITQRLGNTEGGAALLRKLDYWAQLHQKYPTTSKFFYNTIAVLTGGLSQGLTAPALLSLAKTADGVLQGEQLSTAFGRGVATGSKALAVSKGIDAAKAAGHYAADVGGDIAQGIGNLGAAAKAKAGAAADAVRAGAHKFAQSTQDLIPNANADTITPGGGEAPPAVVPPKPAVVPPKPADVPGGGGDAPVVPPKPAVVPPKPADVPGGGDTPAGGEVVVAKGDQIGKLAAAKGQTAQQWIDANPEMAAKLNKAGTNLPIGTKLQVPTAPKPAGSNVWTGYKGGLANEAYIIPGKGLLEGFSIVSLPLSQFVDRQLTEQKSTLNKSLGRSVNSISLTPVGVQTIFFNVEKLHEHVIAQEARRNRFGRETSTALGRQAGKRGQTAQQFAQSNPVGAATTAMTNPTTNDYRMDQPADPMSTRQPGDVAAMNRGMDRYKLNIDNRPKPKPGEDPTMDAVPGDDVTPGADTAPAPNLDTTHKGPVGGSFLDRVEKGLNYAGGKISDAWKYATTKVTAERLQNIWKDMGSKADSDQVAQVLLRGGVPVDMIQSLYSQMGLPEPQNLTPPAGAAQTDDEITAAANAALRGGPPLTMAQKVRLDMMRKKQGLRPIDNIPVDRGDGASTSSTVGSLSSPNASSGGASASTDTGGAETGTTTSSSSGDGVTAQATNTILPQIARMVGTQYADDLITIIDTAMSVLQRSAPTAYREKLMALRGQTAGEQLEKPQEIVKRTTAPRNKKAPLKVPKRKLGPTGVVGTPTPTSTPTAEPATGTLGESRRVYGGKYIKESIDKKLSREFENFLLKME